ncbi:MAG: tetratricopeptide repeat protein [Candidatus Melainabacteria bacterium]|nr:tetratricopeptide repeat protein [Candidatus Melainabacteria bacterium]
MFTYKKLNAKRKSEQKKKLVLDILIETKKPISVLRKAFDSSTVVVLAVFISLFALDLSALCAAITGNIKYAKAAYIISPLYKIDDCHPALSLEIFSGACIESGKFKEAHQYTDFLLDLRKSIYGENDWHYGGMLGNLAGLYYKERNFKKAIETYEESIRVCKLSEGDKHLGSAYTRLANSYRATGKFDTARICYEKALAMRINEYGANSIRVAETKFELANLLALTNQKVLADKYRFDAKRIVGSQKKNKSGDLTSLISIIAFSFAASIVLFGKRGFLTGLAIKRIEQRINNTSSANSEDLALLNKLKA